MAPCRVHNAAGRLRRRPRSIILPYVTTAKIPVEENMAWTTPTLVEICIGLEINGYLPAEF